MATHPKSSPHLSSPLYKGVLKIKEEIEHMILEMKQKESLTPHLDQIEEFAEHLIDFGNQYGKKIKEKSMERSAKRYIKAAIIDLTEVPTMSPEMQRIAYLTALKDATKNLNLFLESF